MQARTALCFLALGDILYAGTPAFHREQVLCVCRDSHSFSVAVLCSSANATPEFEGRGGDDLGTEIANTLYRIFNNKSSVDLQSLCISPREHCWVLCVDVLVSHRVLPLSYTTFVEDLLVSFLPLLFLLMGKCFWGRDGLL